MNSTVLLVSLACLLVKLIFPRNFCCFTNEFGRLLVNLAVLIQTVYS
ncbi:hypothetical protein [Peribacillus frigoritolerans]|nr:hypothetical protein [Peribacillus frigoritolerans]